jgi:hypothetical protein
MTLNVATLKKRYKYNSKFSTSFVVIWGVFTVQTLVIWEGCSEYPGKVVMTSLPTVWKQRNLKGEKISLFGT